MQSIQGCFIIGQWVGGGARFIPVKAAQRCFEAKEARLPGNENTLIIDKAS